MGLVYLIRHAEPVSPRDYDGPDDLRPLSARGRRQAQWMAARLESCGAREVLTSPYTRCRETADIIAECLGVVAMPTPSLHIASGFRVQAADLPRVYVAHSNNIPVALEGLGVDCDACGHGSCWIVELDPKGRAVHSEYVRPEVA